MNTTAPCYRRIGGLEISDFQGGYAVYDAAHDQVCHLNLTAMIVLDLCDGTRKGDAIATILQNGFDLPTPPTADVEACLASLLLDGLIEPERQSA